MFGWDRLAQLCEELTAASADDVKLFLEALLQTRTVQGADSVGGTTPLCRLKEASGDVADKDRVHTAQQYVKDVLSAVKYVNRVALRAALKESTVKASMPNMSPAVQRAMKRFEVR